ncbi:polyprenyl synthetase family protein [Streptomyces scopuliridis]|uniref:polyprenyl synthetase family protein n=1 Tax=Streptomyces scopuliridis TaxID=452529 RepID=UPI0034467C6C
MTEAKAPVPGFSMVFPPAVSDPELERRLGRGLGRVEERLEACTARVADPRMAEIVGHLLAAERERLRPLLALLGSEFGPGRAEGAADAGAVAELVHTASLHHDDVVDRAPVRHGVPSVNALWGNRLAVLAGDWLLGQAARIAVGLGPEAVRLHARTAERLVLGRSRKATGPGPGTDAVEHVEAAGKTAALFSMALSIGALQSGAPRYVVRDLGEFGERLGTAAVDGCLARARDVLERLPDNPAREALDSLCDSVTTRAA